MVPMASGLLFGTTGGVPLALKLVIKFFGDKESSVPVLHGIGIYAYSFSSFLVSSLLCGFIPLAGIQWLLIMYSTATSIMFLMSVYWAELSSTLNAEKRLIVVGAICAVQLSVLLMFKLYFFEHVSVK